jgi:cytochrome c553
MYSTNPNQQVLEAIANLSEQQIQTVLQFIQTLQPKKPTNSTSTTFDPLAKFVGAINNGNLAQQIDKDLYE